MILSGKASLDDSLSAASDLSSVLILILVISLSSIDFNCGMDKRGEGSADGRCRCNVALEDTQQCCDGLSFIYRYQ